MSPPDVILSIERVVTVAELTAWLAGLLRDHPEAAGQPVIVGPDSGELRIAEWHGGEDAYVHLGYLC